MSEHGEAEARSTQGAEGEGLAWSLEEAWLFGDGATSFAEKRGRENQTKTGKRIGWSWEKRKPDGKCVRDVGIWKKPACTAEAIC